MDESIEKLAELKLKELEDRDIKTIVSRGRSAWTRSQTESIKTDKLLGKEIDFISADEELIRLLVIQKVVGEMVENRFNELKAMKRPVPFQVSSRGIRIELDLFDWEKLNKGCLAEKLDLIPYHYEGLGYIKPMSKFKTAESCLPEIVKILECAYLKNAAAGDQDGN